MRAGYEGHINQRLAINKNVITFKKTKKKKKKKKKAKNL